MLDMIQRGNTTMVGRQTITMAMAMLMVAQHMATETVMTKSMELACIMVIFDLIDLFIYWVWQP